MTRVAVAVLGGVPLSSAVMVSSYCLAVSLYSSRPTLTTCTDPTASRVKWSAWFPPVMVTSALPLSSRSLSVTVMTDTTCPTRASSLTEASPSLFS